MTTRRDLLCGYIAQVQAYMNLGSWELVLSEHPPHNPDALLEVYPQRTIMFATIHVRDDAFWDYSTDDQRIYVVHELVHLMHAGVSDRLPDAKPFMPKATWRMYRGTINDEIELMVHNLARLIALTVPLPPDWSLADAEDQAEPVVADGSSEPAA